MVLFWSMDYFPPQTQRTNGPELSTASKRRLRHKCLNFTSTFTLSIFIHIRRVTAVSTSLYSTSSHVPISARHEPAWCICLSFRLILSSLLLPLSIVLPFHLHSSNCILSVYSLQYIFSISSFILTCLLNFVPIKHNVSFFSRNCLSLVIFR